MTARKAKAQPSPKKTAGTGARVKTSKKPAAKRPAHRPSSYKPEYAEQAYKLCLLGATDAKMADFFGVSEQTVNTWKLVHADFLESITRGKEIADAEIAEALFHRAKGYSHPEVHVSNFQGSVTLTPLTKHYPPDTPAASLWLRNRQPARWRDKVELEHSPSDSLMLLLQQLTPMPLPIVDADPDHDK